MVIYSKDKNHAYYGGYSFTRDKKTGYYLSATKIGERRKRLHVFVWEEKNGTVPKGWHVHHVDKDKANNEPDNLACIPSHNHLSHHSKMQARHNPDVIERSLSAAREAAAEWHRSDAGRAWHREQYEKTGSRMYVNRTYKCAHCGKEFSSTKAGSRFCCNAHKTAFRFHGGVDNEERFCCMCGRSFIINKYQKTVTCSRSCAMRLQWARRKK